MEMHRPLLERPQQISCFQDDDDADDDSPPEIAPAGASSPAEGSTSCFLNKYRDHSIDQGEEEEDGTDVTRCCETERGTDSWGSDGGYEDDDDVGDTDAEDSWDATKQQQQQHQPSSQRTTTTSLHDLPPRLWNLCFGALGIYAAYIYHGTLEEDLFQYESSDSGGSGNAAIAAAAAAEGHRHRFTYVWLLQFLESAAAIGVGIAGRTLFGSGEGGGSGKSRRSSSSSPRAPRGTIAAGAEGGAKSRNRNVGGISSLCFSLACPQKLAPFVVPGATQLFSKACTGLALAAGVSFPVVVLAKSAKIVPVLLGQLALGGASYHLGDYAFAILVVTGTALLSLGGEQQQKQQHALYPPPSMEARAAQEYYLYSDAADAVAATDEDFDAGGILSLRQQQQLSSSSVMVAQGTHPVGLVFILLSLFLDGITAGLQKRLKQREQQQQQQNAPRRPPITAYDFLVYTNISMAIIALLISCMSGELARGRSFVASNPPILHLLFRCCLCSAIGQSFVFYVITVFDPLVLSTVTTTRKILSVLLSIAVKGHPLTPLGMVGLGMAIAGLLVEMVGKCRGHHHAAAPAPAVVSSSSSTAVLLDVRLTGTKIKR
jgi:solute carrier family 35 (UDP-galactose transporter), member B1